MKNLFIIAILAGMLGFALYDFINDRNRGLENSFQIADGSVIVDDSIGLDIGDKAPDFELQSMGGEFIQLSDFKGKKVMLNFWATWCPPCREEMPEMEQFYQNTNIEILAINLVETETSYQVIENFRQENELTFPVLLDNGNKAADIYRIVPIPATYLIDSNGIIQFRTYGPLTFDRMMEEYEKLE
ncbi:Peroxiredoxin [Gracilibacillus ureilyticus]|uniref:Peroxiredoxin n=1 Tax=Gracilibacillus ureilyticus TaxID=531814 RepID=A0A1H9SXT5_9BACI|nr:redoxin domain-containing protein [Gracilibacillus ureilyticus]SER89832.1 Peroxiredoxin [Gracilibacillus ureilyticus]